MQMFLQINISVWQSINKIGNERIACQKYGRSIGSKDKYSHKKRVHVHDESELVEAINILEESKYMIYKITPKEI